MGISGFYIWLVELIPSLIKNTSRNQTDNLYIDFNALIHTSVFPQDGPNVVEIDDIMENIAKNVDQIVASTKPKRLLYISTDGVAPIAKLSQQRRARYITGMENEKACLVHEQIRTKEICIKKKLKGKSNKQRQKRKKFHQEHNKRKCPSRKYIFDSNCISPGTEFMFSLEKSIHKFIEDRIQSHINYKNLAVYYSNGRRPGEGKHKILNMIRQTTDMGIKHTIYSPDDELILFGSSLHGRSIKIIKENVEILRECHLECGKCGKKGHLQKDCNNFLFKNLISIDISVLRESLRNFVFSNIEHPYILNHMIDDWILISFFAGNDYLPNLPSFDLRYQAMTKLTNLLIKNFNTTKDYLTSKGTINFSTFKNFLQLIKRDEETLYNDKWTNYITISKKISKKSYECVDMYTERGREKYYQKKLGIRTNSERKNACWNYFSGLRWTFEYWVTGKTNWDWYYEYDHAPLARDLLIVSRLPDLNEETEPLKLLDQQIFILPPQSKNLTPTALHYIFESFPKSFEVDMFNQTDKSQGIAILPPIDLKNLKEKIQENESLLTKYERSYMKDSDDLLFLRKDSYANLNDEGDSLFNLIKEAEPSKNRYDHYNIDFKIETSSSEEPLNTGSNVTVYRVTF